MMRLPNFLAKFRGIPSGFTEPNAFDEVDLADTDFIQNPYPTYRSMRADWPIIPVRGGGYLLVRHADVVSILRDPTFRNAPSRFSVLNGRNSGRYAASAVASRILPFLDPPAHTSPRNIMSRAMRRATERFEETLWSLAESAVAEVRERERIDAVHEIGTPFTVAVMCRLLGLPPADGARLADWSESFFYLFAPIADPEMFARVNDDLTAFRDYLRDNLPSTARMEKVLISQLLSLEHEGRRLCEDEVIDSCILLFADGIENVQYAVGNALVILAGIEGMLDAVGSNEETAAAAVEETMRLSAPAQIIARIATADTEIHGQVVKAETPVFLALGSANRDETVFDSPEEFRLSRDRAKALTFGVGRHACIGGRLASQQARILLSVLARNKVAVLSESETLRYRDRFGHRWPEKVAIRFP